MSAVCLVVLGITKGHGLPFTAIRVLSSYLLRGEDPTPLSVSSSTNEGALLTVQKSQLLMLTSFRYR